MKIKTLYRKYQSEAKWWKLLVCCLMFSIAIIGANIPGRLDGYRTSTDAYVPLTLSAKEAFIIIKWSKEYDKNEQKITLSYSDYLKLELDSKGYAPSISIVEADSEYVWISTSFYVPIEKSSYQKSSHWDEVEYQGKFFYVKSAGSGSFKSLYKVNRQALEKELNFQITNDQIHPNLKATSNFSYRSDYLVYYFLIEVVFLTIVFFLLALLAKKTLNILVWIVTINLCGIPAMFFLKMYSPACWDYDFFHQRILLEVILILWAISALILFPLWGTCAVILLIKSIGKWLKRYFKVSGKRYLVFLAICIFSLLVYEYRCYYKQKQIFGDILQKIELDLTEEKRLRILSDTGWSNFGLGTNHLTSPYLLKRETIQDINNLLKLLPIERSKNFTVLLSIPKDIGSHIYISSSKSHDYADLRKLKNNNPHMKSLLSGGIDEMLSTHQNVDSSFVRYIWADFVKRYYYEGKILLSDDNQIRALIIVKDSPNTIFHYLLYDMWRVTVSGKAK